MNQPLSRNLERRSLLSTAGMYFLLVTLWFSFTPQGLADTIGELDHCVVVSQVGLFANLGIGIRILVITILLFFLPLKSLVAAIYYVRKTGNNANAGTSPAAAWLTFAKATSSVAPGDYVYFGAGTYAEKVQPTVSGTNGNQISFIADTNGTMTGDAGQVNIAINNDAIVLDKDHYLTFDGFRITGTGNDAVAVKDSAGLVLNKCEIFGSKGSKSEGTTSMLMVNCLVRGNTDRGIEIKGDSVVNIWNCTFASNGKQGIKVKDSAVCTIKNTIIAYHTEEGLLYENGTLNHTYNIVYGNNPNFSGVTQHVTELVSDPKFVDSASSNYRLQSTSPAVNSGTSGSGVVNDDLDAYFRPMGSAWEIGCYEKSLTGPLLMAVSNSTTLDANDKAKLLLIQTWGYAVSPIDDNATQAAYNTAMASNMVALVSESVVAATLGTKMANAKIGVVNEDPDLIDEFGFSASSTVSSQNSLNVTNGTHYITNPLGVGSFNLFTSSQSSNLIAGLKSKELQILARWGQTEALCVLDIGAMRYDTGTLLGRRVQLPWGGTSYQVSALNANGQDLLKRSLEWARGVVGYWTLDELTGTVAYDSSINANNGTLLGGVTFNTGTLSPGKLATALQFNGTTDYISVPNSSTLQPTGALSITAWVKGDVWSSGSNVNTILRKGDVNSSNYQLAIADGKVALYLDASDTGGFRGTTTLAVNTWYHVAATWDGAKAYIYVNGKLDNGSGGDKLGQIGTTTGPALIGGTGTSDYFDGAIDDVRFYNYGLDSIEVLAVKGTGQPKGVRVIKWIEIK